MSFLTSCCDLKQKEQYRVFFANLPPVVAADGAASARSFVAVVSAIVILSSCQDDPDSQVIPDGDHVKISLTNPRQGVDMTTLDGGAVFERRS